MEGGLLTCQCLFEHLTIVLFRVLKKYIWTYPLKCTIHCTAIRSQMHSTKLKKRSLSSLLQDFSAYIQIFWKYGFYFCTCVSRFLENGYFMLAHQSMKRPWMNLKMSTAPGLKSHSSLVVMIWTWRGETKCNCWFFWKYIFTFKATSATR